MGGSSPAQGKQAEQSCFLGRGVSDWWNTSVFKAATGMARNVVEKASWQRWSINLSGFGGGICESAFPDVNSAYAKACFKTVSACICMDESWRDVSSVLYF